MFFETQLKSGVSVLVAPETYIALVRVHRLLSNVRVLALSDLGVLTIDRERFEIRKGDEVSLPLWLALELSGRGYAEIRDSTIRDVDLLKYYHMERSTRGNILADVREDIYFSAGLMLSRLSKEADVAELARVEKLRGALVNLLDLRTIKIVNAALNLDVRQPSDISKILEEIVLFKSLKEVLNSWKNSVLRYVK